jgi:hypothetical protein
MCTVSFIARKHGYLLGMNRDEKLTRPAGLPPALKTNQGRFILCPCEPSGGTWIALNETGVTFALINWYSVPARVRRNAISRGVVVNAVGPLDLPADATVALKGLALSQTNPFRLIGFFPVTHEVVEWRWNLKRLDTKLHVWKTNQWISSGFDEPQAQRVRSQTFRQMLEWTSTQSVGWLRRLHRSHHPETGPFSTCMHRCDAATVSYTEIAVSLNASVMSYHIGSPCQGSSSPIHRLQLRRR